MRITNQMKQNQLLFDLNKLQNDVFISQKVLNSGKEVSVPSDDTARARKVMLLKSQSSRRDQFEKNINDGLARLSYSETELTSASNLLKEARQLTIQAANDATSDADRRSIATRVDQILQEMVSIANAKNEDQYLFGGFNTQDQPYTEITDPATGQIIQVNDLASGMDGKIYRINADGEQVQVNIPGTEVFQTGDPGDDGDLFQTLIDLRDALLDGTGNDLEQDAPVNPGDPPYTRPQYDSSSVIAESLDKIDQTSERVQSVLTVIGGRVQTLMDSQTRNQDLQIVEDEHLSESQDADLATWITKFQTQSIALQSAMQIGSQVLNSSLVNFIR